MTSLRADRDPATLRALVERAAEDLEGCAPQEVLRWAAEEFGDGLVVASSMADGVMASLAASVVPGVDVLFLDTGYHFAETLGTRDAVGAVYDVTVRTVLPLLTVEQQADRYGRDLFARDPDTCCALRKVEPLDRGLAPYTAWASGIRRDETPQRAGTRLVEWDAKRDKVKVNPIAAWTQADVDAYVAENGILVNPLASEGYASIGCAPCTRRVAPDEDARAGRWAGAAKTECGLHV